METCADILEAKGSDVFTIATSATILEAIESMCAHRVGALLVSVDGAPCGIISERDVMARVLLQRRALDTTRVEEVMTRDVVCIEPHTTAREAMAVMTERRCRHLPVVVDGQVVGLLSIGDLVRWASREQQSEIKLLSEYIHGAPA
jgi:signal-transduction protein with cAMP-binding, CBS, and nucleotidyltransferase domain